MTEPCQICVSDSHSRMIQQITGVKSIAHLQIDLLPIPLMKNQSEAMIRQRLLIIFILILLSAVSLVSAAGPNVQGPGSGESIGFTLTIPEMADYNITRTEIADLLFMREEEQMAHDLYAIWSEMYPFPIFEKIAQAEVTHVNEVQFLIDRYNVPSDNVGNFSLGYGNLAIQTLSASLAEQGNLSQTDALKAGVLIEEQDISNLDKALANTTREDLKVVYGNLRSGSENHLSAFKRQLS